MNFSYLSDLKILFIGSFVSSNQFYFHDLVKELYELNKVHKLSNICANLDNFNMMLKYQNNEI